MHIFTDKHISKINKAYVNLELWARQSLRMNEYTKIQNRLKALTRMSIRYD